MRCAQNAGIQSYFVGFSRIRRVFPGGGRRRKVPESSVCHNTIPALIEPVTFCAKLTADQPCVVLIVQSDGYL